MGRRLTRIPPNRAAGPVQGPSVASFEISSSFPHRCRVGGGPGHTGDVGGRPSKLNPDQRPEARRMYDARHIMVEQGKILGVSRTSIYLALAVDPAAEAAAIA